MALAVHALLSNPSLHQHRRSVGLGAEHRPPGRAQCDCYDVRPDVHPLDPGPPEPAQAVPGLPPHLARLLPRAGPAVEGGIMIPPHLIAHVTTLAATAAGVAGFGLLYQGLAGGNRTELTVGIPLLLVGLWWAGQGLGRSNLAARRRRLMKQSGSSGSRIKPRTL